MSTCDEDLSVMQGIGKEGVLHKEGAKKVEWKSRLFKLMEECIDYYETGADLEVCVCVCVCVCA